MTTEGAGGLSTANLEAVLDALDDDEPVGVWQFAETARAELAALVEAARANAIQDGQLLYQRERNQGLRDALAAEVGRGRALAAALADCLPFLGGYQCDGMAEGDALTALEGRIDALLAGAGGPGAAGARDEAAGLSAALDGVLATCEWVRDEAVGVGVPLGLLRRLRRALDAPRAGGADS